jgi:hypothetical protein
VTERLEISLALAEGVTGTSRWVAPLREHIAKLCHLMRAATICDETMICDETLSSSLRQTRSLHRKREFMFQFSTQVHHGRRQIAREKETERS